MYAKVRQEVIPCERQSNGPKTSAIPMDRRDDAVRSALLHKYQSGWILIGLNASNKPCIAWHTEGDYTSIASKLTSKPNLQAKIIEYAKNSVLHLNDGTLIASCDLPQTTVRPYDCSLLEHLQLIQHEAVVQQEQQRRLDQASRDALEDERLGYDNMRALDPTMTWAEYVKFRKQCAQQQR